jgi:hypothetical protein
MKPSAWLFLSERISFNLLICLIPLVLLLPALMGPYLYDNQKVIHRIHHHLEIAVLTLNPQIVNRLQVPP